VAKSCGAKSPSGFPEGPFNALGQVGLDVGHASGHIGEGKD